LPSVSRALWKIVFRRLQIGDVDSGPINHGSPSYPIAVYRPYKSDRPL
jgi:hypothetical protein